VRIDTPTRVAPGRWAYSEAVDITGLYWRKSSISAAQCPPGLLALDNDRLSFTTATARVFDVDASSVSGALSGWGSLRLEIDGAVYVFATDLGQMAPAFSSTQQQAISAARRASSLRLIGDWPGLLTAAGGSVTARRSYRRFVTVGLLAAVLLTLAIVSITTSINK